MRKCKRIVSFALAAALMGMALTAVAGTAPYDPSETGEMQMALRLYLMDYGKQKGGDYTITTDMIYPLCRVSPGKVTDELSVRASADVNAWIATTETSDGDNPQVVVNYDSASKKYSVEEPTHNYDDITAMVKNITADGNEVGTGHTTRSELYDNRKGYLCFGDVCGFILAETKDGLPVAYAVGDTAKAFAGGKDVVSLDTLRYIAQLEYAYALDNGESSAVFYFGLNNIPGGYSVPASIERPKEIGPVSLAGTGSSSAVSSVLSSLSQATGASSAVQNSSVHADAWMWVAILALVMALGEGVYIIWRPAPKGAQGESTVLGDTPNRRRRVPTGTDGDTGEYSDLEPEEDHTPRD